MAKEDFDDNMELYVQRMERVLPDFPQIENNATRLGKEDSITLGADKRSYIPVLRIDKYGNRRRLNQASGFKGSSAKYYTSKRT